MKLSDFMCFDAIIPQLESDERDEVISELIRSLSTAGRVDSSQLEEIIAAVVKRENEASTGIGKGVSVPHAKHSSIKDVTATIGCNQRGIDFSSLDKEPVYSVILLLSPVDNADRHLQAMETIFRNLQNDDFRRFLRQAETKENILEIMTEADENT